MPLRSNRNISSPIFYVMNSQKCVIDLVTANTLAQVRAAQLGVGAAVASFSHGFLRLGAWAWVPWPSRIVSGMSFIPGIGLPSAMSAHISAKEAGGGASPIEGG